MNDEELETIIRELPGVRPPACWRTGILEAARREAGRRRRPVLLARLSYGSLAAVWVWILALQFSMDTASVGGERVVAGRADRLVEYQRLLLVLLEDKEEEKDRPPEPVGSPLGTVGRGEETGIS